MKESQKEHCGHKYFVLKVDQYFLYGKIQGNII